MITIIVSGQEEASRRLENIPESIANAVILEMSQIVYDKMQAGADKHTKTGSLFQSVYNRPVDGGREIGHDTGRAPYAKFVLFGTKPHKIGPKNKKSLRWAGPGGFIFARFVNHPGYKGDNYMLEAANEAVSRMQEIVDRHMREL